jgi:hypothetical protein
MLIASSGQIARVIQDCNQHFFVRVAWHEEKRVTQRRKGAKERRGGGNLGDFLFETVETVGVGGGGVSPG